MMQQQQINNGQVVGVVGVVGLVSDPASYDGQVPLPEQVVLTATSFAQGAPRSQIPGPMDPAHLPADAGGRVRMLLQHALFLLQAPRNEWQQDNLPRSLIGPLQNSPGAGLFRRTSEGCWMEPDVAGVW